MSSTFERPAPDLSKILTAWEEWERGEQPVRFSRYRSSDGAPLWYCLNIEGESEWPMRWVGPEITL